MSINVPAKFSETEFKNLKNKKLNNDSFRQYQRLFMDNYKKRRGEEEYTLKDGISQEVLMKIDYVLRRIDYMNHYDTLEDISRYFRLLLNEKSLSYYMPTMERGKRDFL